MDRNQPMSGNVMPRFAEQGTMMRLSAAESAGRPWGKARLPEPPSKWTTQRPGNGKALLAR